MQFIQVNSAIDASVNFIATVDEKQKVECRYVKRSDSDYFIVYISCQTGCAQACRMCHLTATGQNKTTDVSVENMLLQADTVLALFDQMQWSEEKPRPSKMHFNFMARGEPLASKTLVNNSVAVLAGLKERAEARELEHEVLISTIMPTVFGDDGESLIDTFIWPSIPLPAIYYSLYTMDERLRKKWLPRAAHPDKALAMLKSYQDAGGLVKIHFAFIEAMNDSFESIDAMCDALIRHNLQADFNIVRYNPHDVRYGKEPEEVRILELRQHILDRLDNNVKVIPKVGFDVKASCGMFVV